MTMPDNPELITDETVEPWHGPVLPVHIASAAGSWGKQVPPEFAGTMNWNVPTFPNYVQIANRSYRRHRLRLWVPSISGTSQEEIVGSNPPAGSGFVYTVTQACTLISAAFLFTAGTTAANRIVYVQILDASGNAVMMAKDNTAVVASTSINMFAYNGASLIGSATGIVQVGLPSNLVLQPGWTINLNANAIQATDQISEVVLVLSAQQSSSPSIALCSDLAMIQNVAQPGPGLLIGQGQVPFGGGGGMSWENQKPCYATCLGGTGVVTTLDEIYAEVRETLAKESQ